MVKLVSHVVGAALPAGIMSWKRPPVPGAGAGAGAGAGRGEGEGEGWGWRWG